jgi:hypothetical protein
MLGVMALFFLVFCFLQRCVFRGCYFGYLQCGKEYVTYIDMSAQSRNCRARDVRC